MERRQRKEEEERRIREILSKMSPEQKKFLLERMKK